MLSNKQIDRNGTTVIDGEERNYLRGVTPLEYTPWLSKTINASGQPIFGEYLSDYMNREDVREAFHVPSSAQVW